jgi:hypothetical protein
MVRRRFESPEDLEAAWAEYKEYCNNQTVLTHEFSGKNSQFCTAELKRSITYTLEGFCVFANISRVQFYETYANGKDEFANIVVRMREECEIDARAKFELGVIPTQLAGLWMSKHGYSLKTDNQVSADITVNLADQIQAARERVKRADDSGE